jgi:hypothetical protein
MHGVISSLPATSSWHDTGTTLPLPYIEKFVLLSALSRTKIVFMRVKFLTHSWERKVISDPKEMGPFVSSGAESRMREMQRL